MRTLRLMSCPPRFLLALLTCAVAVTPGRAVNNSASLSFAFEPTHGAPAVSIVQPADYLCANVSIRSTLKEPERQAAAIQEIVRRLTTAVQSSNTFQLHQGPARIFGGSSSASYLSSRSNTTPGSLQTNLRVLCPLTPEAEIFEIIRRVTQFITRIEVPADAYWGAQTQRSVENFPFGARERMPIEIVHALALEHEV